MNYYLIDFENVQTDGVKELYGVKEGDSLIFFYSDQCKMLSLDVLESAGKMNLRLSGFKVKIGTKNALDFQLASHLGYLAGKGGTDDHYYIVSNDKGFDCLCDYWSKENISVQRVSLVKPAEDLKSDAKQDDKADAKNARELTGRTRSRRSGRTKSSNRKMAKAVVNAIAATEENPVLEMAAAIEPAVLTEVCETAEIKSVETLVNETSSVIVPAEEASGAETMIAAENSVEETAAALKEVPSAEAQAEEASAADEAKNAKKGGRKKQAKKKTVETAELATMEELMQCLSEEDDPNVVLKIFNQYKTRQAICNGMAKVFKDSKRTSIIYKKLAPLMKKKKKK